MKITNKTNEYREKMRLGCISEFGETDPEFVEVFENFAFDEVVNQDDLDDKTRFMAKNDRANFGSKLGVILASAGSAVGLGNIWRFPYETGNHGGAAFILIYLGCIFLLGLPIMIAEFLIGRRSRAKHCKERIKH